MKKTLLITFFFSSLLFSSILPSAKIELSGIVKDMVLRDHKLIIATDNGRVSEYNIASKTFSKIITLPKIKDFMGDEVSPRIFSVDKDKNRYLLLSEAGKGGYSNLWIHENNTSTQHFFIKDKKAVIKARFINSKHILLAYLSNEAELFDIQNHKTIFRVQLNESKFSDFSLNEDKSQAVFACESGILSLINTHTGKLLKELKGINRDNVYKVDFKQGIISGAGQDRRGAIYKLHLGLGDFIEGKFLIYATGLSPSASLVAFAMDEENNISIFNTQSKAKIAELKGQKSTLNTLLFQDENTLFSASDDSTVLMWKLN